jgi:(2Fe-2S) ferredoxin
VPAVSHPDAGPRIDAASAVLIVGMSVREVQAHDRLEEMAAPLGAGIAYLQLGDPSLSHALTRLADDRVDRVVLVGVSLGSLAPAVSWLRRVAAYWWRERAGHRPDVLVATSLAGDAAEARALATADGGLVRPVTGTEPGLTSAAWEEVTEHRHQVLICRGPRCTAKGSDRTAEAIILELMRAGQGDDDVLVTHTGCQFPCNQAPVVSVQPDDVWYGGVDPDVATEITRSHLVGGVPLETHVLPRRRGRLG